MTMDYEKKYKEALERAREYHSVDIDNTMDVKARGIMEYLFPELQESEDERVRREIMDFIDTQTIYSDERRNRWFSYLENQCETYTKRDVDNAYIEGMASAKRELEKQAEVVSDKDDIEAEEKGIRKAFNKIWEEKQDKQKSQRMISAEAKEALYSKSAKWSEEEQDNFKHLMDEIVCLGNSRNSANRSYYDRLINFLDELKDRAQPREEWCEKDERKLDRLIAYFEKRVAFTDNDYPEYVSWLKSLKPQSQWKPSDEQMRTLSDVVHKAKRKHDTSVGGYSAYMSLVRLYLDLKKLKEE